MVEYDSAMVNYRNQVSIWESMSAASKTAANAKAEKNAIGGSAGLVGLIIGALIWYKAFPDLDALIGIGILIGFVIIFTMIKPLRLLVGRTTRLFVHAIGYFIVSWIAGAIISIWSPLISENATVLSGGLALATLALSAILEASGGHHASAAPIMPSKPNP